MASTKTQKFNSSVIYLTIQGLEDARKELEFLKHTKREELTNKIQIAREMGGQSENSEYDALLEEQNVIENRIFELEKIVHEGKVIEQKDSGGIVKIGSKVVVELDGKLEEFLIVGKIEANPIKKRISNESPVGSVILGARVGDVKEVITSTSKFSCKIIEIH